MLMRVALTRIILGALALGIVWTVLDVQTAAAADSPAVLAKEACAGVEKESARAACEAGYSAGYRNVGKDTVCNPYTDDVDKAACQSAVATGETDKANGVTAKDNVTKVKDPKSDECEEIQGVSSWLVCPLFDKIAESLADFGKAAIGPLFKIEPLKFSGTLYQSWDDMRTLANLAFVAVFLYLIVMNTLSINTNAYTVKKMLPRLIAAALLVQGSYFVSALLVDIGNIVGDGLWELFKNIGGSGTTSNDSNIILNIFSAALGAAAIAGLAQIFFPLAIPIAALLLIAVLAFFLTIAFRYFLIGALIIFSPLAFVAWTLPGTEQWFKKWYTTLTRLIMMYPIIVILLAAAASVGSLVPDASSSGSFFLQSATTSVMKMLIFIACFMAIPMTFKWAGGFMSQAGNQIGRLRNKGIDNLEDSEWYKHRKGMSDSRRLTAAQTFANRQPGFLSSVDAQGQSKQDGFAKSKLRGIGRTIYGGTYGVATGASFAGSHLQQEQLRQKRIGMSMKEFSDLGIDQDPDVLASIADKSTQDPRYKKYTQTAEGRAAALRALNAAGYYDKTEKVRKSLVKEAGNGASDPVKSAEQRIIFEESMRGVGGKVNVEDKALAAGGFLGDDAISAGSATSIRPERLSIMLKSEDSAARMFGTATGKNSKGEDVAARKDDVFGWEGGAAFHVDSSAVHQVLNGPQLLRNSTLDGRKVLFDAFNGSYGQSRLQAAENQLAQLRAANTTGTATPQEEAMDSAINRFKATQVTVGNKLNPDGTVK